MILNQLEGLQKRTLASSRYSFVVATYSEVNNLIASKCSAEQELKYIDIYRSKNNYLMFVIIIIGFKEIELLFLTMTWNLLDKCVYQSQYIKDSDSNSEKYLKTIFYIRPTTICIDKEETVLFDIKEAWAEFPRDVT